MQAVLLEESRPIVGPVPEPRLTHTPFGAFDITVPDVPNIDPSAVPVKVERPVDLPGASSATRPSDAFPNGTTTDGVIVTPPHVDPSQRLPPAEVIAPRSARPRSAGSQLLINVWVAPSGHVRRAYIIRSSGAPWLDLAATQYALTWMLHPGTRMGMVQGMWAEFALLVASDSCCTTLQILPSHKTASD